MKTNKKWIGWGIAVGLFILIMILVLSLKGWDDTGVIFFFKTVVLDNFLGVNALLLGFLTLIGYLILGRGIVHSITGMIKTIIGVLFLAIGAGTLVGMAKPIFSGLKEVTDSKIEPLDPYLGWSSSNAFLDNGISQVAKYVAWVSYALILGFAINIILIVFKKYTNVHSLMVTGHIMFQQTAIMTALIYLFLFRDISGILGNGTNEVKAGAQVGIVAITGLIMGVYWGVASTTSIKGTQKVTNNAGFAVGHQQMFGVAIAYKIGRFFGNPKDSAEKRKFSKKFRIFEDNIFTQSVIILILFTILILILKFATDTGWDPSAKDSAYASWKVASGATWVINMALGSLKLVAAILALTAGVRMFVTELQQAFQGIAQKVIPGAVVAVDIAATYGFSPNSVTYGFVAGVISQFLAVGVIVGISLASNGAMPIVIPLFITLFFNSGSIGVFANASGGWKAAIIVPAIFGFVELFAASGALYMINHAYASAVVEGTVVSGHSPVATGYIGMVDWNLIWGIQFIIAGTAIPAGWVVFITSIVGMLALAQYIDNGMQEKKTFLQKLIRKNMKIVKQT